MKIIIKGIILFFAASVILGLHSCVSILRSLENEVDKDTVIDQMSILGWKTEWNDEKTQIAFENKEGNRILGLSIENKFNIPGTKETLTYEFERKYELKREVDEINEYCRFVERSIREIAGTEHEFGTLAQSERVRETADFLGKLRTNERTAEEERSACEAERAAREAEQIRLDLAREQAFAERERDFKRRMGSRSQRRCTNIKEHEYELGR